MKKYNKVDHEIQVRDLVFLTLILNITYDFEVLASCPNSLDHHKIKCTKTCKGAKN